jgi:phosphoenolpyruvate carboxylase
MAKADLPIARRYAELVEDAALRERVFSHDRRGVRAHARAHAAARHRPARLLEENPVLARSIRLRNPYVDPLSLIQVACCAASARRGGRRARLRARRHHQRHLRRAAQHRLRSRSRWPR